ncbi:hypothetical protein Salat_2815700 [Sesamum alatum]|uniref:Uncharacterized protein n=1 Tax=Sesamum alatum TaxID=300844 RepID=A0AAE1XM85_9LAMI|nr:hypothetical protein Salat_2815700 [Sesamum alatum]
MVAAVNGGGRWSTVAVGVQGCRSEMRVDSGAASGLIGEGGGGQMRRRPLSSGGLRRSWLWSSSTARTRLGQWSARREGEGRWTAARRSSGGGSQRWSMVWSSSPFVLMS